MFRENQQIGNYTLVKIIGRGGFGEVWLAENRTALLTTEVAVKLPLGSTVDLETIRREATLWKKASGHPNVLPIIEANIYEGQVVIVSEYVSDGSLADLLKLEGKLSPEKTLELAIEIVKGLDFLHSRRIIHRDLKPANILLQGDTPRLADFGISHALQSDSSGNSTHIKGTPNYMAPEAFEGKRSVQTDIWSVGVILYQMLSGKVPYPQENSYEIMFAIVNKEPLPLPGEIPAKLKELVGKCLAKEPENRYQSAKELRQDLDKILIKIKHSSFDETEVLKIENLNTEPDKDDEAERPTVPDILSTEPAKVEEEISPVQGNSTVTEEPSPEPESIVKLLPRAAQKLVEAKNNQAKKPNYLVFGSVILAILGFWGLYQVFNWFQPGRTVTSSNIPGNFNQNRNLNPNNSNQNVSNINKNPNSSNLSNNSNSSNSLSSQPSKEQLASLKAKYDEVDNFYRGVAKVKLKGKFGYVDKSGNEIVPPKYDRAGTFRYDDVTFVILNSKYGLIDKTGQEITPIKYDFIVNIFTEGLGLVKLGNKYGFIDRKGNVVIPIIYEDAKYFLDGLAPVKISGKWGYIDKANNEVIPFKFEEAGVFLGKGIVKYAEVRINGRRITIDKNGNEIKNRLINP